MLQPIHRLQLNKKFNNRLETIPFTWFFHTFLFRMKTLRGIFSFARRTSIHFPFLYSNLDNAAGLRSPFSVGLLLAFVIAAKCLC